MKIIMILCDELRADSLGFMGNEIVQTPHLDLLANDSMVFDNTYCNSPMCVPSRVSFATGRYAHSHGALDNMLSPCDGEESFYNVLSKHGFDTMNHGKWHCNVDPCDFGVEYSRGGGTDTTAPEKYVTCFGITEFETRKNTDHKRNEGEVPLIISGTRPSQPDETLDSVVTHNYLNDLEKLKDKDDFFARLSIMDPHTPYIPAEPYASMYDPMTIDLPDSYNEDISSKPVLHQYFRKVRGFEQLNEMDFRKSRASYYGLVSHVDERVGKVIKYLKDENLYDESLIVFTSDHGSMMGEHGFVEKWGHMYEEVMHIPFMIKLPNDTAKGRRYDSFVESVDLMPTLLDYLDINIPKQVQGQSLLPYISGETAKHKDEVYGQYYCGSLQNKAALCIRDKRYKYTTYPEGNSLEGYLPNDHHLKMSELFNRISPLGELYDIVNDPNEMNNLFNCSEQQEVVEEYQSKIDQWMKNQGQVVNTNILPTKNPISIHIIKQGTNMKHLQKSIEVQGKWGQLVRE